LDLPDDRIPAVRPALAATRSPPPPTTKVARMSARTDAPQLLHRLWRMFAPETTNGRWLHTPGRHGL